MSVVKINAIAVPPGAGPELEERFAARARSVEQMPGFEDFQLLRPVEGEERYFVYTRWDSEESFQAWVNSQDVPAQPRQGRVAPTASRCRPAPTSSPSRSSSTSPRATSPSGVDPGFVTPPGTYSVRGWDPESAAGLARTCPAGRLAAPVALIVQKYGGTSVADPDRMRAVADNVAITKRHGNDVVVVVSAMGKATDNLIALADPGVEDPARAARWTCCSPPASA